MNNLSQIILTGIVSLIVGYFLNYLKPKSNVIWGNTHSFLFNLKDPKLTLFTHAYMIQNSGRKEAENLQIALEKPPDYFKLEPALKYTEFQLDSGEYVIEIPNLGPKEYFSIEFLAYRDLSKVLYIRTKNGGQSKFIKIRPQIVYPKKIQNIVGLFLFLGIGTFLYWVVRGIILLISIL